MDVGAAVARAVASGRQTNDGQKTFLLGGKQMRVYGRLNALFGFSLAVAVLSALTVESSRAAGEPYAFEELPVEVQAALQVVEDFLATDKGKDVKLAIADFKIVDLNNDQNPEGAVIVYGNYAKQVTEPIEVGARIDVLSIEVEPVITITASPDCRLEYVNGRPYWMPASRCPN